MIRYNLFAIVIGILFDFTLGKYINIRKIASYIARFIHERIQNNLLCFAVMTAVFVISRAVIPYMILHSLYGINKIVFVVSDGVFIGLSLSASYIYSSTMRVYNALKDGNIDKAKTAVSDFTKILDNEYTSQSCADLSVLWIARNISERVISPLIFSSIGGGVLSLFYTAVSAENENIYMKRFSDIIGFIPQKITAMAVLVACAILHGNPHNAFFTMRKYIKLNTDTIAVCAGSLMISIKTGENSVLCGGDRKTTFTDILFINRLMYTAFFTMSLVVYWFYFVIMQKIY